jgi:hypothetical protein
VIVFDLDGTLANFDHRKHIIEGKSRDDTLAWALFYQSCGEDKPIYPMCDLLMSMLHDYEIEIWTGRSENCRLLTIAWLKHHVFGNAEIFNCAASLKMRPLNDRSHDWELKERWLHKSNRKVDLVFEDRDSVVSMFRKNNVLCAQVAPGAY